MIVEVALRKGRETGCAPLAVAVLDAGGHLKCFAREDGAGIIRPQIAIGKAWGALGMGLGLAYAGPAGDRSSPSRWPSSARSTPCRKAGWWPAPGGVLIRDAAGALLGAVGISGRRLGQGRGVRAGRHRGGQARGRSRRLIVRIDGRSGMVTRFRLAPMSPVILILTLFLLLLPILLFVAAFTYHRLFVLPALFLLFISAGPGSGSAPPSPSSVPAASRSSGRCAAARSAATPSPPSVASIAGAQAGDGPGSSVSASAGCGVASAVRGLTAAASSACTSHASTTSYGSSAGREQPWLLTPEQPDVFVHALPSRDGPAAGRSVKIDRP